MRTSRTSRLRSAGVRLSDLSLARIDGSNISLHPLVHEWARIRLSEAARQQAWEKALCVLALSTTGSVRWMPFSADLRPHMQAYVHNQDFGVSKDIPLNIARGLYVLGCQLGHTNLEMALNVFEVLSEHYHPEAHTWSSRGEILAYQKAICLPLPDRSEEAEDSMKQVLEARNRFCEADSAAIAQPQIFLGSCYNSTGKMHDTVLLLTPLWKGIWQFSSDDIIRSDILYQLADAHLELGDNIKATELSKRVVDMDSRLLSHDAPARVASKELLMEAYINMGHKDLAINLVQELTRSWRILSLDHPSRLRQIFNTVYAYVDLGNTDQTLNVLEQVSSELRAFKTSEYDRLRGMRQLADAYLHIGENYEAIALLEEVIPRLSVCTSHKTERLYSMEVLAHAYIGVDRNEQAVVLLEEVISKLPVYYSDESIRFPSKVLLARAYTGISRPDQAVTLFEEVMPKMGDVVHFRGLWTDSMYEFARACMDTGRVKEAVDLYEELIPQIPTDTDRGASDQVFAICDLADWYAKMDRYEEAVSTFQKAISGSQACPPNVYNRLRSTLAMGHFSLGQYEMSVSLLETVLSEPVTCRSDDRDRLDQMETLAMAHSRLNNHARAATLLEEVIEVQSRTLSPGNDRLLSNMCSLASAYSCLENHDQVIKLLEEVIPLEMQASLLPTPERTDCVIVLSWSYIELGIYNKAEQLMEQQLEYERTDKRFWTGPTLDQLARAYKGLGRHQRIIDLLEATTNTDDGKLRLDRSERVQFSQKLAEAYIELGGDRVHHAVPILMDAMQICQDTHEFAGTGTLLTTVRLLQRAYLHDDPVEEATAFLEDQENLSAEVLILSKSNTCTHLLVRGYQRLGQDEKAATLLRNVVGLLEVDGKLDKKLDEWKHGLALEYGSTLEQQQIVKSLLSIIDGPSEDLPVGHRDRSDIMHDLAMVYLNIGTEANLCKAVSLLESVCEIDNKLLGVENPDTIAPQRDLAEAYRATANTEMAQKVLEATLERFSKLLPSDDRELLRTMVQLAHIYLSAASDANTSKAATLLEAVISIETKPMEADDEEFIRLQHDLVHAYLESSQMEKALELQELVVESVSGNLPSEHMLRLCSGSLLAQVCLETGNVHKAIVLLEEIVEINARILPLEDPDRLISMRRLGVAYMRSGVMTRSKTLWCC